MKLNDELFFINLVYITIVTTAYTNPSQVCDDNFLNIASLKVDDYNDFQVKLKLPTFRAIND